MSLFGILLLFGLSLAVNRNENGGVDIGGAIVLTIVLGLILGGIFAIGS